MNTIKTIWNFIWAHRAEIRAALVRAIAVVIVCGMACYAAGGWTRRTVDAMAARSVELLPSQPLAAVAPITANLQAAWEILDRLIDWCLQDHSSRGSVPVAIMRAKRSAR